MTLAPPMRQATNGVSAPPVSICNLVDVDNEQITADATAACNRRGGRRCRNFQQARSNLRNQPRSGGFHNFSTLQFHAISEQQFATGAISTILRLAFIRLSTVLSFGTCTSIKAISGVGNPLEWDP